MTSLTHRGLRWEGSRQSSNGHQEVNSSSNKSSGRQQHLARWVPIVLQQTSFKEIITIYKMSFHFHLSNFTCFQPGQQQMAGIQRVVINQPGLRPGQPGAQITVPLSTLQVSNRLDLFIIIVTNSNLIPICAGASGWPGNSHWPAWPPLGQDRNWPVSGKQKYIFDRVWVALFDMPNSNRFYILSILIFSKISLSILLSISRRRFCKISLSIRRFWKISIWTKY